MGSIRKFDPREARVQVGENFYTRTHNTAKGTHYLDIRSRRHVDEVEANRSHVRDRAKPSWITLGSDDAFAFWESGRIENFRRTGSRVTGSREDVQKQRDG